MAQRRADRAATAGSATAEVTRAEPEPEPQQTMQAEAPADDDKVRLTAEPASVLIAVSDSATTK